MIGQTVSCSNLVNGIRTPPKIGEDGDFLVYYNKQYHGIPSPIEQNRRHIKVLEECLKTHDIMPKRLGIPIKPNFINYVLMSANSRIIRPQKSSFNSSAVIKVDSLRTTIDKEIDNMQPLGALACVTKLSSSETVMDIAQRIAALHKPMQVDYAKRFGVALPQTGLPARAGKRGSQHAQHVTIVGNVKKTFRMSWRNTAGVIEGVR